MAELIKHIDTHIELDFMLVSSYHGGTSSSGVINIIKDMIKTLRGVIFSLSKILLIPEKPLRV